MATILLKIAGICNSNFKCNDLKNEKHFTQCFVPFLESIPNFKHFLKMMMVSANVFPKLQTVKNFFKPLSKKRRFATRLDGRHVKVSRILAKSP